MTCVPLRVSLTRINRRYKAAAKLVVLKPIVVWCEGDDGSIRVMQHSLQTTNHSSPSLM